MHICIGLAGPPCDLTALDQDSLVHLAEALGNPLVLLVSVMPQCNQ